MDSLAFFRIETLMSRKRNTWARDAKVSVIKNQSQQKTILNKLKTLKGI